MKPTNKHGQVNPAGSISKSTYKAEDAEKAPTRRNKKALTRRNEKTPPYYISSWVDGLINLIELKRLLLQQRQYEWCTRVKLLGLLLLIEYFTKRRNSKGLSCSADLAHGYVSKIGRPKSPDTIREPLAVLCKIGVLRLAQAAVIGPHLKHSALYAFDNDYVSARIRRFDVALPPHLVKKRKQASERYEKRLRQRQPFRAQLQQDLQKISFNVSARSLIADLLRYPKLRNSTVTVVAAIDGKKHSVHQNPRGQIATTISSCLRELKPLLLLDGQPTVVCDISHAHYCSLPRIVSDRINYIQQKYIGLADTAAYDAERERLLFFLSEGDYYRKWCVNQDDDSERQDKKQLLTMMMNWPNAKCEGNALHHRMRRTFPLTFGIVEDIKRNDHRNISKQLQHYTARAIRDALLELQGKGIPAIPDVDAIICQEQNREAVCEVIGRKVYEVSGGVCCMVDDIRYSPFASAENESFDLAVVVSSEDPTGY